MKKIALLTLPLLLGIIPLSGCGKTVAKTKLQYGQMIDNEVVYIDYQTLKEKFESKGSFLVTVYAKTCSCWTLFHSVLNQYITENHVQVFAVNYDAFHDESGKTLDNFGLKIQSGYTSFAIVNNGEFTINEKSDNINWFKNQQAFKDFMADKVILPKMFYISLNEMDQLYKSPETSVIYFARNNCGDCTYLDKHVLNSYEAKNNLYILDCETIGIREYGEDGNLTPASQVKWTEFKENYRLASKNNPTYGFDTGYVPTLFLFNGNSNGNPDIKAGSVYFNDSITKKDDKYYVEKTYYTEDRNKNQPYLTNFTGTKVLDNLEIKDQEVGHWGEYVYWDQDAASKYHTPLVKAFLDYSLDKVTHKGFTLE